MSDTNTLVRDVVPPMTPKADRRRHAVWLLTNAPSPYQAELFSEIADHADMMLDVRLMRGVSTSGQSKANDFNAVTMSALAPKRWRDEFRLHPRAIREAAFGRFDCYVLSGLYTSVTFLCCAALLSIRGQPWIAWLERPRQFGKTTSSQSLAPLRWLRDLVRKRLLHSATRVLCIGTAARDAYSAMGVNPDRLDVLPYCCDIARYDRVSSAEIIEWRRRRQLTDQVIFLFSGQLIPRKGVETLLDAFQRVAVDNESCSLVILGDGPLRAALQSRVAAEFRERVAFLGHLPQEELPVAFRAADVFVFPSRHDGWGVVINEACAARLPVIATQQTGAVYDLVEDGESGFVHSADDVNALTESMRVLLHDPERRRRMGERSRVLVEAYSPERGASIFADCVKHSVN